MVEIKVGVDLDMAVAEACGFDAELYYAHNLEKHVCLILPSEKVFAPSTDLNDAFAAAEKVGLLDEHSYICRLSDERWSVWVSSRTVALQPGDSPGGCYINGPTASLAICAAILALKDGKSTPSDDESFVAYARKRLHELGYHVS